MLDSGRAVEEVAASYGVAWWTVQDGVDATVVELPEVDTRQVLQLGVDEHPHATDHLGLADIQRSRSMICSSSCACSSIRSPFASPPPQRIARGNRCGIAKLIRALEAAVKGP